MVIEFFSETWWIGLFIGSIIAVFIQLFAYEFLPDRMKDSAKYWRRKIGKIIRPRKIKVELVVKTFSVTEKKLDIESTLETLRKEFVDLGYNPAKQHDSLIFDVPVGSNEIHISINTMPTIAEDKEIIDMIECRLKHECGYLHFNNDVRELREAQMKIASAIRTHVSDFQEPFSLICELNSLYELTGVLADVKIGMMYSNLEQSKTKFELSENKITVYDEDINTDMLSFLKKMVTVYY